jgi:hypothetical protein
MDSLLTGKDQLQADQPNTLAERPPYKSKSGFLGSAFESVLDGWTV